MYIHGFKKVTPSSLEDRGARGSEIRVQSLMWAKILVGSIERMVAVMERGKLHLGG